MADATLEASTNYHFLLICDPYPADGNWNSLHMNKAGTDAEESSDGGSSWSAFGDDRDLNYRIYIDGSKDLYVETEDGSNPLGTKDATQYGLAQKFTTGVGDAGTLTKLSININTKTGSGASNVTLEVREGHTIGSGNLVGQQTGVSITASSGWIDFDAIEFPTYSKRIVHDGLIDSKQKTLLVFDHTFESQIFDRRLLFDALIDSKKKGLIQHDGIVRAQLDKRIAFDPSFSARHKKRIDHDAILSAKVLKRTEHTGILDAYVKSGYRVDAINVDTGAVTDLGFASAVGSPIEITGISLSPGKYDLRFWLQGYYWDEWMLGQTMRVVIEGSPGGIVDIESDLPPALQWGDPEYDQVYGRTVLHWIWAEQFGATTPDDFLIWIQDTSPVDVGQTPDAVIWADVPREYDYDYEQTATSYVAICARTGDTRGHYITATIPYELSAPDSPVNQFAHRKDVL